MPVSVISFDIDGTLLDLKKVLEQSLTEVSKMFDHLFGQSISAPELQNLRNAVAAEPDFANTRLESIRRESFRRALILLGRNPEEHLDNICTLFFELRFSMFCFYPDVEPALKKLRNNGMYIITASNGNSYLSESPVASLIQTSFFADDIGYKKPDPKFFLEIASRAGISPDEICHVGDSPEEDYKAARAAGMKSLLIKRSTFEGINEADTIRSLEELSRIFGLC